MQTPTIKGIEDELDFWREFIHSDQFATWLDDSRPTPELDKVVLGLIRHQRPEKVLDVGSGVVSLLRGTVPASKLLTVDLLADRYKTIFDYASRDINPPLAMGAEEISWYQEYDLVHMSNALDHCQDPVQAFANLKNAVKPGGCLIIQGFVGEGSHLRGLGMHQWDLNLRGYDLSISSVRGGKGQWLDPFPLKACLECCFVKKLPNGREWIVWCARKPEASINYYI